MSIPHNPDSLLRRNAVADALTEAGFPVAKATLATMATRGGGPPYRRFGRVPLYSPSSTVSSSNRLNTRDNLRCGAGVALHVWGS
jgi:hypothetical protein